jgi:hypothetical protein
MIHKYSCYSDIHKYHQSQEEHVGYKEMRQFMLSFLSSRISYELKKNEVLEFGAGSGLLTKKLIKLSDINLNALEPDERFREYFINVIPQNKINLLIDDPVEKYSRSNYYDFIISSFAHDHIKDGGLLAQVLYDNLKSGGFYICGLELLRSYKDKHDYEKALEQWHGFVIDKALQAGNSHLVKSEEEALESGRKGIADFKVSPNIFENDMKTAGFKLYLDKKVVPHNITSIGGVYVYVWEKSMNK